MQIPKCLYVCVYIKTIPWKFRILNPKNSRVIYREVCKFLKSRLIFNILLFLNVCKQTSHISSVHISRTKRCFIVKSSAYYFHMKTKMLADFQACISVPLMHTVTRKPLTIYWKPLTVFTKSSSWDVWQGSEYVSVCNGVGATLVCLTSSKRHNFLACFLAHRFSVFCFFFSVSFVCFLFSSFFW